MCLVIEVTQCAYCLNPLFRSKHVCFNFWLGNIAQDCTRYSDLPCQEANWMLIDPGEYLGGMDPEGITRIPSERYDHSGAILDELRLCP